MSYILVHHHMDLPENVYNKVPFSWRIRDYLEELCVQAQYITNAEGEPRDAVKWRVPAAREPHALSCGGHSHSGAPGELGHRDLGHVLSWAFLSDC